MLPRSFALVVVGMVVAPWAANPLAIEPDRPLLDTVPVWKKDVSIDGTEDVPEAAPVVTYGVVVSLREHEMVVLSDSEPSDVRFSRLLRDRVTGDSVPMARGLVVLLQTLSAGLAESNTTTRVEIVSGYRSSKLNEMLRKKGRNVASNSHHVRGTAMDFRIEGMSSKELADTIERTHWRGGLAFYPGDTDRFVHADVGPNRRWRGR